MMKYWINSESSSDNVAMLVDGTVVIGSCEEEELDAVTERLQSQKDYSAIFGTDNFIVISFSQLEYVAARSTEEEIDIEYKAKKDLETLSLDFKDQQSKNEFLSALESQLPTKFKKKEVQQSALTAAFPSLVAFLFGAGVSVLYWNKLRWITIIVGGLWLLLSAYSLFKRITNPPVVTTLSTRNVVGSVWQKLKLAGSLTFVLIVALAFSTQVPDSYGERAIADHIDAEELTVENLPVFVSRGSSINSVSDYGWTALHQAIYEDNKTLFSAALAEGADPLLNVEDAESPIDFLISYERADMLETLLKSSWEPDDLASLMPRVISSTNDTKMMSVLYDHGLSPEAKDQHGNNALQLALANSSSYELVVFLLEKSVPSNVQIDGSSMAEYALENGQDDVARLFSDAPRNFAKDRELSEKIDTYFLEKVRGQLENAPPIVKMIINGDGGVSDADYKEMVDEVTGSYQHKSMVAWGNHLVLSGYADLCNDKAFSQAEELNKRVFDYGKNNLGDIQIAELIFERNRSVYIESKNEFVVPQDIKAKYLAAEAKLKKQFDASGEREPAVLLEKCKGILERLSKKDKS